MKTQGQHRVLVSVFIFVCMAALTVSVRASDSPDQYSWSEDRDPASAYLRFTPLTDTVVYTQYLPLITRPPGMLYGNVTDYGVPAANVGIDLQRCLTWGTAPGGERFCATWDTYSTTTDHNGRYTFIDPPTLVVSPGEFYTQTYQARWDNYPATPNHLMWWDSRVIDRYTEGDIVNLGNFDIGGIALLTPTTNSTVYIPLTFQWTPRHNVPTDRYDVCVEGGQIIPKFDPGDLVCFGPYAYTGQTKLSTPFDGIDYGYGYSWYVEVPDDTGGVGRSPMIPFTFASP